MYTKVKTKAEIDAMRTSGKLLATVLATLKAAAEPGMTTRDLSELAARELRGTGGQPSFLGYPGVRSDFSDIICISVNEEVVHGLPGSKVLNEGDILSLDFGVTYDGMITDAAISFIVGEQHNQKNFELVEYTKKSLYAGIATLKDGVHVGDIAHAVQLVLEQKGYGIVRDLVGHGVGHELHEDPNIPNVGSAGTGPRLQAGMTIAIEPMATLGGHRVILDEDGWTIRTADGSRSAHFEHTVLITEEGSEILTTL